jgi:hypothetical protein
MLDYFKQNLSEGTKYVIVRRQGGGQVLPAVEIAMIILHRHLDVIIYDRCLSSCANYLFLAARYKFLMGNALVGWHESPGFPTNWIEYSPDQQSQILESIDRHKLFFTELPQFVVGVPESLLNMPAT